MKELKNERMSSPVKKYVHFISIAQLERGDIIRHRSGGKSYIVDANYGNRATAVNTVDITNPIEWEVLREEKLNEPFSFEPDKRADHKLALEHKRVRVMRVAPIKELVQGQFFRFHALEAPRIVIALDKEKLIAPFIDPEYKGYRPADVFKLGTFGHKLDVEFLGMEI